MMNTSIRHRLGLLAKKLEFPKNTESLSNEIQVWRAISTKSTNLGGGGGLLDLGGGGEGRGEAIGGGATIVTWGSGRNTNIISRAFLRSEQDRWNIDIYRGFIEIFVLFWDCREPLIISDSPGFLLQGILFFYDGALCNYVLPSLKCDILLWQLLFRHFNFKFCQLIPQSPK